MSRARGWVSKNVYKIKQNEGHTEKGKIVYVVRKANDAMDAGKFLLAQKILNEADDYSQDFGIIKAKIRLSVFLKDYEHALELCNETEEEHVILRKMSLYLYFNDYDNIKRMYNEYFLDEYTGNHDIDLFNYIKYEAMGVLGSPITGEEWDSMKYGFKQAYAYNEERALEHIKRRHGYYEEEPEGRFLEDVDIDYLYNYIKEFIMENPDAGVLNLGERRYQFYYPNAGINENGVVVDYICAIVSISNNIMTFYPCSRKKFSYNTMENDYHNENAKKLIKK